MLKWFRKKEEVRENEGQVVIDDPVLKALLEGGGIDRNKALNIPTIAGGVEKISSLIAGIPIKVYQERDGDKDGSKDTVEIRKLFSLI